MQNYIKWLVALTLVAALIAVGCIGCGGEEGETYKVGAVFDTTGPNSPLGGPEKQMVELMVEQINDNGGIDGHELEVIVYDTGGDETECVTLVTRLIEQDNVLAIIGPTSTGESLAIINTIDTAEIPLVSCAADERITLPVGESEWAFKTPQTTFMAVQEVYEYIAAQGISKIAILTDTKGFGAGGKQDLLAEAPNYDLTVVAEQSYNNEDPDMTAQLNAISGTDAEAVICWGTNPGPANIAKGMKELGMTIPLFCSHGIANTAFITLGEDAANGVIFPVGKMIIADQLPDTDPQKAVLMQIKTDYEAAYGAGTCNTFAGHAYDALTMVTMALEKAGPDKAEIREELEDIKNFAGTGGIFNMSPQDHCGLSKGCMVIVEIVDGEWVWIQ